MDKLAQSYEQKQKPSSIPSYKPLEKLVNMKKKHIISIHVMMVMHHLPFYPQNIVQWSSFWVDFALHLSNPALFSIDNDFSTVEKSNKRLHHPLS
jgi:hypothetical protein